MKKHLLFLFILVYSTITLQSTPINQATALTAAQNSPQCNSPLSVLNLDLSIQAKTRRFSSSILARVLSSSLRATMRTVLSLAIPMNRRLMRPTFRLRWRIIWMAWPSVCCLCVRRLPRLMWLRNGLRCFRTEG